MIFDINMDVKFTRNARFVEGLHRTDPPLSITYSIVVSRYSSRLVILLALLNDLYICAMDLWNAYLNSKCRDKVCCLSGP